MSSKDGEQSSWMTSRDEDDRWQTWTKPLIYSQDWAGLTYVWNSLTWKGMLLLMPVLDVHSPNCGTSTFLYPGKHQFKQINLPTNILSMYKISPWKVFTRATRVFVKQLRINIVYQPANDRIKWVSDAVKPSEGHTKVDPIFVISECACNTIK